ncbi:MAG: aminotransferase class I/II-fold pyridoxal phosphate-dependent enzyme, partial [Pseudomonadota bacterium]
PDLHIDADTLNSAVNPRTRLIVLNFPHNPSGALIERQDLDVIAQTIRGRDIYLASDEVYEHIVFDGAEHHSLLTHDELWERSFVISSFGKTYHVTGWKIGYCVAPPALTREFRKVHQWNTFTTVTPMQLGLADFMAQTPEHYAELRRFYQNKRDRFCGLLKESRFSLRKAAGTFFQVLDYGDISAEDDAGYARRLTREAGIASIPVSVFCAKPTGRTELRFCFAKHDETLEQAAEVLCQL